MVGDAHPTEIALLQLVQDVILQTLIYLSLPTYTPLTRFTAVFN